MEFIIVCVIRFNAETKQLQHLSYHSYDYNDYNCHCEFLKECKPAPGWVFLIKTPKCIDGFAALNHNVILIDFDKFITLSDSGKKNLLKKAGIPFTNNSFKEQGGILFQFEKNHGNILIVATNNYQMECFKFITDINKQEYLLFPLRIPKYNNNCSDNKDDSDNNNNYNANNDYEILYGLCKPSVNAKNGKNAPWTLKDVMTKYELLKYFQLNSSNLTINEIENYFLPKSIPFNQSIEFKTNHKIADWSLDDILLKTQRDIKQHKNNKNEKNNKGKTFFDIMNQLNLNHNNLKHIEDFVYNHLLKAIKSGIDICSKNPQLCETQLTRYDCKNPNNNNHNGRFTELLIPFEIKSVKKRGVSYQFGLVIEIEEVNGVYVANNILTERMKFDNVSLNSPHLMIHRLLEIAIKYGGVSNDKLNDLRNLRNVLPPKKKVNVTRISEVNCNSPTYNHLSFNNINDMNNNNNNNNYNGSGFIGGCNFINPATNISDVCDNANNTTTKSNINYNDSNNDDISHAVRNVNIKNNTSIKPTVNNNNDLKSTSIKPIIDNNNNNNNNITNYNFNNGCVTSNPNINNKNNNNAEINNNNNNNNIVIVNSTDKLIKINEVHNAPLISACSNYANNNNNDNNSNYYYNNNIKNKSIDQATAEIIFGLMNNIGTMLKDYCDDISVTKGKNDDSRIACKYTTELGLKILDACRKARENSNPFKIICINNKFFTDSIRIEFIKDIETKNENEDQKQAAIFQSFLQVYQKICNDFFNIAARTKFNKK